MDLSGVDDPLGDREAPLSRRAFATTGSSTSYTGAWEWPVSLYQFHGVNVELGIDVEHGSLDHGLTNGLLEIQCSTNDSDGVRLEVAAPLAGGEGER